MIVGRRRRPPAPPVTHRRRRVQAHPDWCGRNHVCSAESGGTHRSYPLTMDNPGARVVLTRVQTRAGINSMEIRAVVDLPTEPAAARAVAATIVKQVCRATVVEVEAAGAGR